MDDRTELERFLHLVDEVMNHGSRIPQYALPDETANSESLRLYDELIELIECKRALLTEGGEEPGQGGEQAELGAAGLEDARSLTGQLERLRAQRSFWAGLPAAEH
jgi:hypothetical protein